MGKCIICGCDTNDFRCRVREENGKSYDDYQCEKCTMEKVEKARNKYMEDFNREVLPYLMKNNFRARVSSFQDGKDIIEEFPIKADDIMYCVDIIRDRMLSKGYYENWIDIHWEEHNGVELEIVDYLCYALPEDKKGDSWVSYYIDFIGDNDIRLNRIRM